MIEKVRVHEIAKELGINSKDVLKKVRELNDSGMIYVPPTDDSAFDATILQ